jgi:hypothetical protein
MYKKTQKKCTDTHAAIRQGAVRSRSRPALSSEYRPDQTTLPQVVSSQIKSSVSATLRPQRLNCAFAMVNVALPKVREKPGFRL